MSSDLSIAVQLPQSPLVLLKGEIIARVDDLVATAAVMSVTDAESAQAAAGYMRQATALAKEIESARTDANAPALALQRAINAAVKAPAERLDAAKRDLQKKVGEYQAEHDRIRRQREADLKREQDRIAAEQKKAAEEQRLREEAAFLAGQPPPPPPAPVAPVVVAAAPHPVVAPKIAGVRMRSALVFEVVDVAKLPEALTVRLPDSAKIRAQFCLLWREGDPIPEVPGLRFAVDRKAVAS